jgi:hypothetical protein
LVGTVGAAVDERHGASVARPWQCFRRVGTSGRPRAMEGVWAP